MSMLNSVQFIGEKKKRTRRTEPKPTSVQFQKFNRSFRSWFIRDDGYSTMALIDNTIAAFGGWTASSITNRTDGTYCSKRRLKQIVYQIGGWIFPIFICMFSNVWMYSFLLLLLCSTHLILLLQENSCTTYQSKDSVLDRQRMAKLEHKIAT